MSTQDKKARLRWIIINIFDKTQHNRVYLRLIHQYLPAGKKFKCWMADKFPSSAIENGHLFIVQQKWNHDKQTKTNYDISHIWKNTNISSLMDMMLIQLQEKDIYILLSIFENKE
jgi:hypothetical protein